MTATSHLCDLLKASLALSLPSLRHVQYLPPVQIIYSKSGYAKSTSILIDTLQIAPIPGNPSYPEPYQCRIPSYPIPTIITQGTMSSVTATDPSATLSFALAISNFVCSGIKLLTVVFVPSVRSIYHCTHWPISSCSCHTDLYAQQSNDINPLLKTQLKGPLSDRAPRGLQWREWDWGVSSQSTAAYIHRRTIDKEERTQTQWETYRTMKVVLEQSPDTT